MEKSHALVADLEETTLRESGPVLDGFIRDTQAEVTIFGPDGQAVDTGSRLAARLHEDANAVAITSVEIQDVQVTKGKAAIEEGSLSSYSVTTENLTYPFSFAGEEGEYTVHISPVLSLIHISLKPAAPARAAATTCWVSPMWALPSALKRK